MLMGVGARGTFLQEFNVYTLQLNLLLDLFPLCIFQTFFLARYGDFDRYFVIFRQIKVKNCQSFLNCAAPFRSIGNMI